MRNGLIQRVIVPAQSNHSLNNSLFVSAIRPCPHTHLFKPHRLKELYPLQTRALYACEKKSWGNNSTLASKPAIPSRIGGRSCRMSRPFAAGNCCENTSRSWPFPPPTSILKASYSLDDALARSSACTGYQSVQCLRVLRIAFMEVFRSALRSGPLCVHSK